VRACVLVCVTWCGCVNRDATAKEGQRWPLARHVSRMPIAATTYAPSIGFHCHLLTTNRGHEGGASVSDHAPRVSHHQNGLSLHVSFPVVQRADCAVTLLHTDNRLLGD
jgi:hypothetical protein